MKAVYFTSSKRAKVPVVVNGDEITVTVTATSPCHCDCGNENVLYELTRVLEISGLLKAKLTCSSVPPNCGARCPEIWMVQLIGAIPD